MYVAGDVTTVATVYGAILLGTCFGSALTGVVFVQCVLYYKLYPGDSVGTKILVFAVWAFDLMHTICIISAVWESVIVNFNQPEKMDDIPIALGASTCYPEDASDLNSPSQLSVAVTAAVTFMVHCFFANRIRMLMKRWYVAGPVMFLAFLRLFAACVSTGEIIHLKRYSSFIQPYPAWVFTTGVTLSASVEIIITTVMCIFLGSRKPGSTNTQQVINSLILYTLETGSITCLVTVASLICWILMRHNLIFLGMHFAIAKLYANSLLATLNTRRRLRVDHVYSSERDNQFPGLTSPLNRSHFSSVPQTPKNINVNVETSVISQIDDHQDDYELEHKSGTPTLATIDEEGKLNSHSPERDSADKDVKYQPFAL